MAIVAILAPRGLAAPAGRATTQPAKPTAATEPCANDACHTNLMTHKVMHGPAAQRKCQACHEPVEPRDHTFRLASPVAQLCGDCHTLKHRSVVHAPVTEGRCTGCHDPHGSDYRAMLLSDPTRGLCLSCHQKELAGEKFVHGPVASGACILCHEPHSSWEPKLLTEAPQKLCLRCHGELVPRGAEARHVHAPVNDNCTGCHDAHASQHKFQLRADAPALCLDCHKDVAAALADGKVVHGAATDAGGCLGCHTPHFSKLAKLQKDAQPQACLSCHDKPLKDASGKELTDFATLLKDNPQQHGPIREGACTACGW
jgi:predicted CXXCH cytochrome family protein